MGFDGYLSGTVGVAREAAMHGIPAISSSIAGSGVPRDLVHAAEEVLGVARRVTQWGLPPYTFLNVYTEGNKAPEGTDIWAVNNGYVAVTPMKATETDASQLEAAVKAWFK